MDGNGKTIPFVDDDQGEGIKDFLDEIPLCPVTGEELAEKLVEYESTAQEEFEKNKTQNEILEEILNRLESLERFVRQAIGNHFLLHGKWEEMRKL